MTARRAHSSPSARHRIGSRTEAWAIPITRRHPTVLSATVLTSLFLLAGLVVPLPSGLAQSVTDEALEARVAAALRSASDVPADMIDVTVLDGVVTLSGSVACEKCGGRSTPPAYGTVQQSLGAVVRAVPGVNRVEFELRYRPSGSAD